MTTLLPTPSSQVPFLGSRKRDDKGQLGPYTWMTYAQVWGEGAVSRAGRATWG